MPETSLQELNGEVWCRIAECPDYAVSDLGRVVRILKDPRTRGLRLVGYFGQPDRKGGKYAHVNLYVGGRRMETLIHRLVARYHVLNPSNKPYVNHKDGNPRNNRATNLEWVTMGENNQHAYDTGLNTNKRKDMSTEELIRLYQTGLSLTGIGLMFCTSASAVRYRLLKAGISTRPVGHQGRRWTQR